MGTLTRLLVKGVAVLLVIVIALSVVGTVLSLIVGIVSTIVSLLVSLAVLALVGGGIYGLYQLLSSDSEPAADHTAIGRPVEEDPLERLHSRYVNGEISEAEFERKLELHLDSDDVEAQLGDRTSSDRTRLRDRL